MVGDRAEHHRIAQAQVTDLARQRRGVESKHPPPRGLNGTDRIVGIREQPQLDHRRHQTPVVDEGQSVGAQHVLPAQAFGGLETEQQVGAAGRDLRREHARAEAQVRGNHATALRHPGDLGLLDVVPLGERRFGENFGRRHHPLPSGADDENVGDFRHDLRSFSLGCGRGAQAPLVSGAAQAGALASPGRATGTMASGAHGVRHRPQPVQPWASMRTKARATALPLAFTTVSRRVT